MYRWDEAELASLGAALRHARWREAGRIVRPHRRSHAALFRLSDPGPLVARLIEVTRRRAHAPVARATGATAEPPGPDHV